MITGANGNCLIGSLQVSSLCSGGCIPCLNDFLIHIKAINKEGEFYGIKAISAEGQLNDVKGVKVAEEALEATINGVDIQAHIKSLPQTN